MSTFRIALANMPFPATPEESVVVAEEAIAQPSSGRADLICAGIAHRGDRPYCGHMSIGDALQASLRVIQN